MGVQADLSLHWAHRTLCWFYHEAHLQVCMLFFRMTRHSIHPGTLEWQYHIYYQRKMGCVKRIWYLSPMQAAKVQASLRIRAVSPEPSLLAHISSESRGTFRQKARSLAPLNGWAYAVKICHDRMLEDTNSLDAAQIISSFCKNTHAS